MIATPSTLRLHFRLNRSCNLYDLCQRFNKSPDVLRPMLAWWINKGKMSVEHKTNPCNTSCQQCDPLTLEVYHWL